MTVTDEIGAGSIFIEEGTHLPNSLLLRSAARSDGWTALNGERAAFETELREGGWTFFYMAGEINTTVFGFDKQKALREALQRLIATVKSHKCNSIEITQVTGKSFLKVPYVKVYAHPRHLQRGVVFAEESLHSLA